MVVGLIGHCNGGNSNLSDKRVRAEVEGKVAGYVTGKKYMSYVQGRRDP